MITIGLTSVDALSILALAPLCVFHGGGLHKHWHALHHFLNAVDSSYARAFSLLRSIYMHFGPEMHDHPTFHKTDIVFSSDARTILSSKIVLSWE